MARFRFSRRAEADLLSIGDYTLRTWGKTQAAHYIGDLQVCCQTLAGNPALGRLCDDVRPGLHRLEHAKHVLFYRQEREGILVSRILHRRMLPDRHAIDDQDVTSLHTERLASEALLSSS
jgi:toxin ParE1/3/4